MKLITQPNSFSCMACSFAMATDSSLAHYIEEIGHDGSEIWWPEMPQPFCRRCFTPPECFSVAFSLGYFCHEIRNGFEYGYEGNKKKFEKDEKALFEIMKSNSGVLYVENKHNKMRHAVAWNGEEVFDPLGFKTVKESYDIDTFIVVGKRRL